MWCAYCNSKRDRLRSYKEAGTELKAEVTALYCFQSLILDLHCMMVLCNNNDNIDAAACILPLTESTMVDPGMGTRHRAALGILKKLTQSLLLFLKKHPKYFCENGRFVSIGMDEMDLRRYLNERMFISSGD